MTHASNHAEPPHIRRGAVGVIVRAGRLLVIERSQHVAAPGALCFPGGAIEPGESEEAALVRELREELNVVVEPVRRLWMSVTAWQVELNWWLADLHEDHQPHPNPAEVAACVWLTAGELRNHPAALASNLAFLDAIDDGSIVIDGLLH